MSVAIQFTQNFLGVEPECGQVCKFVKEFRPDLLGVRTAGIEVPCKLVEIAAHLAALSKQGGNGGQGFFAAACNDDRFLDLDVVDGAADKSGEGEIIENRTKFNFSGFVCACENQKATMFNNFKAQRPVWLYAYTVGWWQAGGIVAAPQ